MRAACAWPSRSCTSAAWARERSWPRPSADTSTRSVAERPKPSCRASRRSSSYRCRWTWWAKPHGRALAGAADLLTVVGGLAVEVLIALAPVQGGHGGHPEVVGISAEVVDGLPETGLNFEAPAVEADDVQWGHGQVGAEEDPASAGGVDDPDKAYQLSQGAPEQIAAQVAESDLPVIVERTGGAWEAALERTRVTQW